MTSFQLEQARSATRRGALCACGLLLSVAVVYSTRGGNVELLTGDADPAAYKIAQARARLAASEVELKNSKERLRAIDALLAKQQADSSTSRLFKGVKQLTQSGEGLKSALLAKAENFELQADVSAASIASAHLKGQPLPSLSEQQHKIDEEDDKMFAHVLRQQAERLPGEATLPPQMRLFLQQYRTVDQLKMGRYNEESRLETAREAAKRAEEELVALTQQQKRLKPASKTDEAEEEAMAIERLGEASNTA